GSYVSSYVRSFVPFQLRSRPDALSELPEADRRRGPERTQTGLPSMRVVRRVADRFRRDGPAGLDLRELRRTVTSSRRGEALPDRRTPSRDRGYVDARPGQRGQARVDHDPRGSGAAAS